MIRNLGHVARLPSTTIARPKPKHTSVWKLRRRTLNRQHLRCLLRLCDLFTQLYLHLIVTSRDIVVSLFIYEQNRTAVLDLGAPSINQIRKAKRLITIDATF